jgi:3-dehydroquinate synthase
MKNHFQVFKTQIYISDDALNMLDGFIADKYKSSKKIILTDENTLTHCLPVLKKKCQGLKNALIITVKSGEQNKSIETAQYVWQKLNNNFIDRNAVFINLGGGVLTDLGAFCASTYMRGIKFINMPTTLLGMVDASVGAKTGIDFLNIKNLIGTFAYPEAVFIWPGFLSTLDNRNINSGKAEMIKHALVSEEKLWNKIKSILFRDLSSEKMISKSVKIKCNFVKKDPFDKSIRKVLNFGHTIGHAVESWSVINQKDPLLHGECVAIGILMESFLSYKMTALKRTDAIEVAEFIDSNYILKKFDRKAINEILALILYDKKNTKSGINFTLLESLGKASTDHYCDKKMITEAFSFYNSIAE